MISGGATASGVVPISINSVEPFGNLLTRHFAGDALFFFGLGGLRSCHGVLTELEGSARAAMMARDQVLLYPAR
ncbi:hypothetical protein MJ585_26135 [Klebsiella pneumoniae]|nr:hypothetical protein MJ585_26135 [Klebsiella pneumoniae]